MESAYQDQQFIVRSSSENTLGRRIGIATHHDGRTEVSQMFRDDIHVLSELATVGDV